MKTYAKENKIYYNDIKGTEFEQLWDKMHNDYFCASMADFGADREQREVLYDYGYKFKVIITQYFPDFYGNMDNEYIVIR